MKAIANLFRRMVTAWMGRGLDPRLRRKLENAREMVSLQDQTPIREWPLVFVNEHDKLLVVREWPNGSITAYVTSDYSDLIKIKGHR